MAKTRYTARKMRIAAKDQLTPRRGLPNIEVDGILSRGAIFSKHMADRSFRDVGGTPGGLGPFLAGLVLACIGGYLLTNQVMVTSSYWNFYGTNTFGITLLPMLIGVAMLFWNGRSALGWLLTVAGGLFIIAGVIANLHIYFAPTSLFNTLVMLVLLVGGLALIARALRAA
jgi:hypothetical protein